MALKKFVVTKIVTHEITKTFYAEDEAGAVKTAEAFEGRDVERSVQYVDYSVEQVEG
jgi:hypothetical protein